MNAAALARAKNRSNPLDFNEIARFRRQIRLSLWGSLLKTAIVKLYGQNRESDWRNPGNGPTSAELKGECTVTEIRTIRRSWGACGFKWRLAVEKPSTVCRSKQSEFVRHDLLTRACS